MIPNPSSDPLRRLSTPLVPEIKTEIGAALKAARVKKGQSLEAVGQQTRISKRFLQALEDNRFDEFPALAYLRGFLKSYCDYLELDFEAFWRAIETETPGVSPKEATAGTVAAAPQPPAAPKAPKHGRSPIDGPAKAPAAHAKIEPPAPFDSSAAGRAVLFAFLIAVGVAVSLHRGDAGRTAANPPPTPPSLEPVHQPSGPSLIIEFRQESWIMVRADGHPVFEGKVPRNSRQEWTAKKTLTLRAPDTAALKLTLNGTRYALPAPDASGEYLIESP